MPMKTIKYYSTLTIASISLVTSAFASDTSKQDLQIVNKKSTTSDSSDGKKTISRSDTEISKTIIVEIVREDTELAAQTRRLKISTVNGYVTLTGKAKNEKQKQTIGTIASRVAGADKVENKLEVR